MWAGVFKAIVLAFLEWLGDRTSAPSTGRAAGRDDALRDRIRGRVRAYEDGVRRARNADSDRS